MGAITRLRPNRRCGRSRTTAARLKTLRLARSKLRSDRGISVAITHDSGLPGRLTVSSVALAKEDDASLAEIYTTAAVGIRRQAPITTTARSTCNTLLLPSPINPVVTLRPERGNWVANYDASPSVCKNPLRRQFATFYDHKKVGNTYPPTIEAFVNRTSSPVPPTCFLRVVSIFALACHPATGIPRKLYTPPL